MEQPLTEQTANQIKAAKELNALMQKYQAPITNRGDGVILQRGDILVIPEGVKGKTLHGHSVTGSECFGLFPSAAFTLRDIVHMAIFSSEKPSRH
jgi:hypothetical protein